MSTLPGDDMALPSTFPAEIEDLIIDELHGDVWTLRQCALTCSGWLPRSRYNLYFSVRVDRKEKLLSLYSAMAQAVAATGMLPQLPAARLTTTGRPASLPLSLPVVLLGRSC